MTFAVNCSWCGKITGQSAVADSHGLCSDCLHRLSGIPHLSENEIDALPFGAILLNREGIIFSYNAAEQQFSRRSAETVLGRNFFTDIAPCTQVKDFQGRFKELFEKHHAIENFEFLFNFAHGNFKVVIIFVKQNPDHIYVLIKQYNY
jgi:photoactive yellow protein